MKSRSLRIGIVSSSILVAAVCAGFSALSLGAASSSVTTATIRTNAGNIKVHLRTDVAPSTVKAFTENCQRGVYNGMALRESDSHYLYLFGELADGSLKQFHYAPTETRENNNGLKHIRGALAIGVVGTPEIDSYELYFCRSASETFDGVLTVFGQIDEGMDLVDEIASGAAAKRIGRTVTIEGVDVAR